jgi:hypothetical protein
VADWKCAQPLQGGCEGTQLFIKSGNLHNAIINRYTCDRLPIVAIRGQGDGASLRRVTGSDPTRSMEHPRVGFDVEAGADEARRKHPIRKCSQSDGCTRHRRISFKPSFQLASGPLDRDAVRSEKSDAAIAS